MGSKNLKAFVARGTGSIKVADKERFMNAVEMSRKMCAAARSSDKTHEYGTLFNYDRKQEVCGINYKNFQYLTVPESKFDRYDPRKTIKKFEVGKLCFPGCAIHGCGRKLFVNEGPYKGLKTECNQWEAFSTLQTRLAIDEPTFMLKANALCNDLGIDVDAAGGSIGWAMECFQRGIIDESDTSGRRLDWGNAKVVLKLIQQICYREKFGNILAEGSFRAADMFGRGSAYYSMHIKGQDLYEVCRGVNGYSLGTTTSTRGGGHTTGAVACEAAPNLNVEKAKQIYGVENPNKPLDYDGKAKMTLYMEVLHRVNNCLGVCHINTTWWDVDQIDLPQLAELYSAATGWETSVEDFYLIAMRQLNMEKAFNLRHTNFNRKDDMPTQRDLSEPIPEGNLAGWKMDEALYNKMLDDYYDLHGWDRENGYPKRKTLEELGISYVADDLEQIGKLGC
jgi:aldehyde:ferredoxin oxidoreductase